MEFNQLIFNQIVTLLNENGFLAAKSNKNYFEFHNGNIEITVSYNELDKTCLFEIGETGQFLYPINNDVLKSVFRSDLKFEEVRKEKFVDNVEHFFKNEGQSILYDDLEKVKEIKYFVSEQSKNYTSKILQEQKMNALNTAWEIGNYKEFINLIDKSDLNTLHRSYQLKYKIAIEKTR